jgi:hypothetical protein
MGIHFNDCPRSPIMNSLNQFPQTGYTPISINSNAVRMPKCTWEGSFNDDEPDTTSRTLGIMPDQSFGDIPFHTRQMGRHGWKYDPVLDLQFPYLSWSKKLFKRWHYGSPFNIC